MATAACQSEDATSVARIVWRALLDAPPAAVQAAMNSGLPDYAFVDDINSRTSLHETALAGNLQLVCACVQSGIDVRRRDIYGRTALSYAAMSGHADVCTYLLSLDAVDASSADLDGFSPLVLAVMSGQVEVVRILLAHGVSVEAAGTSDLIPLCLASQGGHAEITQMLLQRGAKLAVANPEGLTPQALAAREGHAECLSLLMSAGADRDALEKGTLWTPLFFAAESGHASCVRILLDAGARVDASDEKSRTAAFYAAWRGQIDCLLLLLDAGRKAAEAAAAAAAAAGSKSRGRDELSPKAARKKSRESEELEQLDLDMEMDGIPSLSLPPPIIPFRTYGHNYLDKRALVTVSLTNSSVKLYKLQDPNRPEQFSTSSLKLVMTSRPDASTTTIPHTIFLPLADDREVFSFQVDGLERFYLEWELMPTFGSKVIGKAVALPSSFDGMTDRKRFTLPLQDVYLKIVGEVSFELDFVKPFDGVQLEIGGRVETYWKSTLPTSAAAAAAAAMDSATPSGSRQTPTSLSASTSDAPVAVSAGGAAANALAAESYVTASSLSGQHLRVAVQVTKDGVAVVYPAFTLPVQELDVYVGSVTGAQFASLAKSTGRALQVPPERRDSLSLQEWKTALQRSMVTLDELLEVSPPAAARFLYI
jgi:CDK inhibitor PHO81